MSLYDKLGQQDRWEWMARLCRRYLRRYGPDFALHPEISRLFSDILHRRQVHQSTRRAVQQVLNDPVSYMVFVNRTLYEVPREMVPRIESVIKDNRTTQLYRHFDKNGVLLYVGISLSTIARLAQHRADSKWFGKIARIEIENFRNLGLALHAERTAIRNEKPLYNRSRIRPDKESPLVAIQKMCHKHADRIDGVETVNAYAAYPR